MSVLWEKQDIKKIAIETIQINLGNKCNQRCVHCHIGASPSGTNNMTEDTAHKILEKITGLNVKRIEFTGGAPELNPNLPFFIKELANCNKQVIVRTNLTVLEIPEYTFLIDIFKKYRVRLVASLPSYFKDITEHQRGSGVFEKSIRVLKELNKRGYGGEDLFLDLVYNPQGDYLPPSESDLEKDYKKFLNDSHGITFHKLFSITNTPIGGFKQYLINEGKLEEYMSLLVNNFNPETLHNIMCRSLLSIDYQGYVYDCDFNLALGIRVKDYENIRFWEIDFDRFSPKITCDEHCYACTVNRGSSCHGVLLKSEPDFDARQTVKQYYGNELTSTADLKTGACCTTDSPPDYIQEILPHIAEEIKQRYYGCGSPIPIAVKGTTIVDIGCGTGRDTYVLSKLVGENGSVYGIDMTENQIEVAEKYRDIQTRIFEYKNPNVYFIHDYIENIEKHFIADSIDIIVSNCVVNLIEDKANLIRQVYSILKNGGEFYFSDIYVDRRLPFHLKTHPVLYGECLGGSLYWKDFERLARRTGFVDPRIVSKRLIDISNKEIQNLIGNIRFYSITYRLWKIDHLEDACEDYGHVATYSGGIEESPFQFSLDESHIFEKDKPERVCGNTALMLSRTRFADFFHMSGSFEKHFGEFQQCSTSKEAFQQTRNQDGCSC